MSGNVFSILCCCFVIPSGPPVPLPSQAPTREPTPDPPPPPFPEPEPTPPPSARPPVVDPNPFVPYKSSASKQDPKPTTNRDPFMLYIDSVRYVPDNATILKVRIDAGFSTNQMW